MLRMISFGIVGTIGFTVDSGVFLLLFPQFNVILSKIISFVTAVIVTFFLNRQFTFISHKSLNNCLVNEINMLLKYLSGQVIGFITNIVVFTIIMIYISWAPLYPIIPLAISSIIALFVNYFLAKLAFTHSKKSRLM